MRLPFQLLSIAAALLSPLIDAGSTKRNPIGSISSVRNATIHTKTGRVTALSEFDLTFTARDDLYVKFSLEPNHDIFGVDALITHLGPDGSITHKESVDRLGHKVFKGTAWIWSSKSTSHEWQSVGWARASIHKDGKQPFFEGAFSVFNNYHHIQSSTNYLQTRHPLDPDIERLADGEEHMVLWRDSDIRPLTSIEHQELRRGIDSETPSCHYDDMVFNRNPEHPVLMGIDKRSSSRYGALDFSYLLGKRQIDSTTGGNSGGVDLKHTIGNPAGCPTTRKVALVGVATDCTYTDALGSKQSVTQNVISQMNQASGPWEAAFNISLGLQNLTISDKECPSSPNQATEWNQECSNSVDIQDRLNYFSAWRADQGGDNSHWTLLSTCNTGSAVGLAWLGQACVGTATESNGSTTGSGPSGGQGETVSGANVVIRTSGANEWAIIAHETGHTFGAVHDCDSQTCADAQYVASQQCCPYTANTCDAGGRYIMNPFTEPGVDAFSPCTIGNVCSAIGRKSVDTSCLSDNKNVQTYTGQQCGNGIVEPGEECDCGGEAGCGDDSCCNPQTCKFQNGAVCDDFNSGCCVNCQFASKGTVCRASTGQCDPKEVCPGDAGNCPADKTEPDGTNCGGGLQCISGQCTSRDQQCKTVMGSYTQGNDTYACDSQSCTISCSSPEFGYGVCYGLQQNFLDGTPCAGSGRCENGQCKGASFGGELKSWIDDHKTIVIPIVSVVGALILLSIFGCCWRRHKRRKMQKRMPPPPPGWNGWQGNRGPRPNPQMSGYYAPRSTSMHNAPPAGDWAPPPGPPPTMSGARTNSQHFAPPSVPPPAYSTRGAYG